MSLTRGPNWPTWLKKRYVTNTGPQPISMIKKTLRHQHGAPANLHDKKNVTSPTWGPNWPFRCLDVVNIYKPLHFPSACACFCCSTVFLRNVGHKLMSQGQTTKCSLYSDEILWKVGATCYPHDFHKSEKRKQWYLFKGRRVSEQVRNVQMEEIFAIHCLYRAPIDMNLNLIKFRAKVESQS